MRVSSTNIGIVGYLERLIRSHPLIYIFFRSLIRFSNIFEKDFDGCKNIFFKKKINIIDVGASDGISIKYFFNNLPVNKIICFEPYEEYINILKKIKKKIIIKPFAIGNKSTEKKIFFPRYKFFNKFFDIITYAHYDKELLKHFIKDFKYRTNLVIAEKKIKIQRIKKINYKIDLIKIDTNGFELNIIKGLLSTIKKSKPALIVEINKDSKKISKILNKLNYRAWYYSIKEKKFQNKKTINATNKFFLQSNHIK
jgi:FkbM family methyltransferase